MLRSRFLLALALVTLNACSMTFDGSKLGVPVTMGSKAGTPAKGQPFKVSSGSLWVLWGAVPVKKPSLRQPLSSQLVGGQTIEDMKITVGSRWYDVLVSVITLGIVTPRTVTLEGVIVGDPTANLPGADYTPAPTPVAPGVAAAPVPVTTPMGANDPTSQPYDLSVTQGRSAFEITPMVAYIFGGGFNTDALDDVPPGNLSLRSGIGYGAEIGFTPNGQPLVRGHVHAADRPTSRSFPTRASPRHSPRRGLPPITSMVVPATSSAHRNVHPFLGLGVGATIFDPGRDSHRQQHELLGVGRGRYPHDAGEG